MNKNKIFFRKQESKSVDLTISIVNWNGQEILKRCLHSIYEYADDVTLEIIVVDNASTDNSVSMIKKDFPEVIILQNKRNIGFGRANNLALSKSKGRYILVLNPDIILIQPCLKQMMNFLKKETTAGCIGCKLINIDGSIQESYFRFFPTPWSQFKEAMMINRILKIIFRKDSFLNENIEVAWVVGASMMFRRDVFKALNGFNERFFMFGEDVDICYRLKNLGYRIIYLANIEMFHYHAACSNKQSKRYFSTVLQKESRYQFIRINYNIYTALMFRIVWIIGGFVRTIIMIPVIILSLLIFNKKRDFLLYTFEKYVRVFSWGLGFEKWVRKEIPQ